MPICPASSSTCSAASSGYAAIGPRFHQPSQADYWQATKATGHGDFHIVVYAPSTVQEMADYAFKAFDTADKYRVPVMIMADGMLGQMMEPVVLPEALAPEDLPEKPWATCGHGHKRPHNVANSLYLTASDLEDLVRERYERYAVIEETEQEAESYLTEDADIVLVAFGGAARVARSAVNAAREQGHQGGSCAPHIPRIALPDPRHPRRSCPDQGVPRCGDEHGPRWWKMCAWRWQERVPVGSSAAPAASSRRPTRCWRPLSL